MENHINVFEALNKCYFGLKMHYRKVLKICDFYWLEHIGLEKMLIVTPTDGTYNIFDTWW